MVLVVDENDARLLKMTESLLKFADKRTETLKNYKKYALKIDEELYNQLINEINKVAHSNLSLVDELKALEEVDDDYSQLEERQFEYKDIFDKYSFNQLQLSDLSKIDIDAIRNKKNAISGYLLNLDNIKKGTFRLEKLNEDLIDLEKKRRVIDEKVVRCEGELRDQFLKSDIRIVKSSQLKYLNISAEYIDVGIDMFSLIDNPTLLSAEKNRIVMESDEASKKEEIAQACYDADPAHKYKSTLEEIKNETLLARYKEVLIKILFLVSEEVNDVIEAKFKREKIVELMSERTELLKQRNIILSSDPFSHLKVKSQLEWIRGVDDNVVQINNIRSEINDLGPNLEEMRKQNINYLSQINSINYSIDNNKSLLDIVRIPGVTVRTTKTEDSKKENQVVGIQDVPISLNLSRVSSKTNSVVSKVNDMVSDSSNGETIEGKSVDNDAITIIPDLIITKGENNTDSSSLSETNDDVFCDSSSIFDDDVKKNDLDSNQFTLPSVMENYVNNDSNDIIQKIDDNENVGKKIESNVFEQSDDIFSDVGLPFDDSQVKTIHSFNDASSLESVESSNVDSNGFPETFWAEASSIPYDNTDSGDKDLDISFDEQINKLLNSESMPGFSK